MNSFFYSLKETTKAFFFSPPHTPASAPYVRDPVDIKRIMMLVVIALVPATFFAIMQSGLHAVLYDQINLSLMNEYLKASNSVSGYFAFLFKHFFPFFIEGCKLFVPQLILIYTVGGVIEIFFASLHRKTVSEGFLVTGILFALVLPPTIPYWMTTFGVAVGLILGKELFGGTGMNIFNPALVCRCILYFSFPSYMSGNIWVGSNQFVTTQNVITYNKELQRDGFDSLSTASPLNVTEISNNVTRLQIDAVALLFRKDVSLKKELEKQLREYNPSLLLGALTTKELTSFITNKLKLPQEQLESAYRFARLLYGHTPYTNGNLYFGNIPGSFGETSKCATHIGIIILLLTGLISFRIILPAMLAALLTAGLFYLYALSGPNTPAHYFISPIKQLLMGGLTFGIAFMATDPVSGPTSKMAQMIYGSLIGALTIIIRLINPAYPEGVMLAILFANAFAPLLDKITLRYRKKGIKGHVTFIEGGA